MTSVVSRGLQRLGQPEPWEFEVSEVTVIDDDSFMLYHVTHLHLSGQKEVAPSHIVKALGLSWILQAELNL